MENNMDTEELYSENKEIQESNDEIVKEMKKFNWGAFGLGWIWGIFNKIYIKRLTFPCMIVFFLLFFKIYKYILKIPVAGVPLFIVILLGPLIYFGINGNKWASEKREWKNIEEFKKVQKMWAIITLIIYSVITFFIICYMAFISSPKTDKYTETTTQLINIIMSDYNYKYSKSGNVVADQLVNYINDSSWKYTKAYLFNSNTVKISHYDKFKNKYLPFALYSIVKEESCNLQDKNCYITTYMVKNKRTAIVLKAFFDDNADITLLKYAKKEK